MYLESGIRTGKVSLCKLGGNILNFISAVFKKRSF